MAIDPSVAMLDTIPTQLTREPRRHLVGDALERRGDLGIERCLLRRLREPVDAGQDRRDHLGGRGEEGEDDRRDGEPHRGERREHRDARGLGPGPAAGAEADDEGGEHRRDEQGDDDRRGDHPEGRRDGEEHDPERDRDDDAPADGGEVREPRGNERGHAGAEGSGHRRILLSSHPVQRAGGRSRCGIAGDMNRPAVRLERPAGPGCVEFAGISRPWRRCGGSGCTRGASPAGPSRRR